MTGKVKVIITNDQKVCKIPTGVRLLVRKCCHAVLTLEAGGDKVADLRDDRKHKAHQSEHEIVNGDVTEEAINDESEEKHSQNGEYNTADAALYRLLRADLGDKLMLAKESAHEVCERIAHPGADEGY